MLKGMNGPTYAQLAPLVTVYSPQPAVDVGVAPEGVLRALPGLQPEQIEELLRVRRDWLEGRGPPPPGLNFGGGLGGGVPVLAGPPAAAQGGQMPMIGGPAPPAGGQMPVLGAPSPMMPLPRPEAPGPALAAPSPSVPADPSQAQPAPIPGAPAQHAVGQGAIYAVRAAARTDDGATFIRNAVVWVRAGPEPSWWVLDWSEGSAETTTARTPPATINRRP